MTELKEQLLQKLEELLPFKIYSCVKVGYDGDLYDTEEEVYDLNPDPSLVQERNMQDILLLSTDPSCDEDYYFAYLADCDDYLRPNDHIDFSYLGELQTGEPVVEPQFLLGCSTLQQTLEHPIFNIMVSAAILSIPN